jgi:glucose/arabinose dehydrogenase
MSRWFRFLALLPFLVAACRPALPPASPTETPQAAMTRVSTLAPTDARASSTPSPTFTPLPSPTLPPTRAPSPMATSTPLPAPSPTLTVEHARPPAVPNPGDYQLALVVKGLQKPTYLTHAGDGSGRLFITEQVGRIRIVANGRLLPEPFLDITSLVGSRGSEQGLLSVAFHPQYPRNGYFFVNYTDRDGDTVVARYRVSADPHLADPGSGTVLLTVDQPYANHNGGQLQFGPDGYLYIGMGDGGSAGDPQNNGQRLDTLLGKLLRLDVDSAYPYAVPPDNPFRARPDARPEIWAFGLRNPWRFSFDRATGDLYIADVGQNAYEEVDFQPAQSRGGENYGWNLMEGNHPYGRGRPSPDLTVPVAEYAHAEGGCSVTGGYVYRGARLPDLNGFYIFGDYCSGLTWTLRRAETGEWERHLFLRTNLRISSFGEDEAGELYVVDHAGAIYRLEAAPR